MARFWLALALCAAHASAFSSLPRRIPRGFVAQTTLRAADEGEVTAAASASVGGDEILEMWAAWGPSKNKDVSEAEVVERFEVR
jgi:hypothetical protein